MKVATLLWLFSAPPVRLFAGWVTLQKSRVPLGITRRLGQSPDLQSQLRTPLPSIPQSQSTGETRTTLIRDEKVNLLASSSFAVTYPNPDCRLNSISSNISHEFLNITTEFVIYFTMFSPFFLQTKFRHFPMNWRWLGSYGDAFP